METKATNTAFRPQMSAAPIRTALAKGMWQQKEQFEHWSSLFHCIVVPMNDLAHSLMLDAIELLKEHPKVYRHAVKKAAKEAKAAGDEYNSLLMEESRLNRYGDRTQYLMDYMDEWQEDMKHDIDMLRFSITRYLHRVHHAGDAQLSAAVFLAHAMLVYSCELWDSFWKTCEENTHNPHIASSYRAARLTSLVSKWDIISGTLDPRNEIDLNADKNCRLALDIIERKCTSIDTVNRVGERALDLNEELKDWADQREERVEKEKQDFITAATIGGMRGKHII